ncbi:hypothetical protein FA13DRAFT_121028 [Coprinellus micaceus]|uniref:Uncharacterized protein n=1 Tax=Coprinellus micaceus TaxID=71717 RepID=A0A4Y7TIE0_COPMI|nr:hypothetical protein FA13DRAFT_121028 [Coprinellus micaceus]
MAPVSFGNGQRSAFYAGYILWFYIRVMVYKQGTSQIRSQWYVCFLSRFSAPPKQRNPRQTSRRKREG